MSIYFKHPTSGKVMRFATPFTWLWVLLFGPLWCAGKGFWGAAVISFILAFITLGISHLCLPFFSYWLIRRHYNLKGWTQTDKDGNPVKD